MRPRKFVVYHVKSTMEKASFCYEHSARELAVNLNAKHGEGAYDHCTIPHYLSNVVHMVTRKNLMTGKEYQEPSNTPGYLSPSREAYWSM